MTPTPMMAQWQACKTAAKDALLLFRMGDFYEAFYEDAAILSKELDLTLTTRQEIPMSGVPHHTCDAYIDRLVAKGYKVAVAEQTSDPKTSKGLVKREVVRVVTPGTVINSSLLSDKTNNFFASVTRVGSIFGLAVLDLTTGDFRVAEFEQEQELLNEISRLRPAEFLSSKKFVDKHPSLFIELRLSYDFLLNTEEDWRFDHQVTSGYLLSHFGMHSLDGFGLKGMVTAINAAGALLQYLKDSLCLPVNHIYAIQTYSPAHFMAIDRMSERNLELTRSLQDGSKKNTLLGLIDKTLTPMGGRLIQRWIKQPLMKLDEIHRRQDGIEKLVQKPWILDGIKPLLEQVRDLERLMMKVSAQYATPRDLVALCFSMYPLGRLKSLLSETSSSLLSYAAADLDTLPEMTVLISTSLVDEPPLRAGDGNLFREGYNSELDDLRAISSDSKTWLARYQGNLREQTSIKTLKIGFNRMFGYYIEVSKGQVENVPLEFERRQTLVNAERFVTPELKEYEQKVLTAEEKINALESELFLKLRTRIAAYSPQVLKIAQAVALLDTLYALAETARQQNYIRPIVDASSILLIEEGRHPVIEAANKAEPFIPNDTLLDSEQRLYLITGPNMAGKSTYIRQVALISILAQMGSFIPARSARIGLIDKVFTRIGASDDLSRGQSTFMVEMTETANILNNATDRSLVILDEIGRGTSTYDGISIAWSVAEFLLTVEGKMAKTLFATHYWELTKLEEKVPGAVNYNVAVHEGEDLIVFLRKIVRGGTDKSYGIHVGRLAGLPPLVIERAKEILVHLEENANRKSAFEPSKPKKRPPKVKSNELQLSLFG